MNRSPEAVMIDALTSDQQPLIGRDLEFHGQDHKYLGHIVATDTVMRRNGTLVGVTIKTAWLKEAEPTAPDWTHARESGRREVFIPAADLDGLVYREEDGADRLILPHGITIIIMPPGDNVDPAQVSPHGY